MDLKMPLHGRDHPLYCPGIKKEGGLHSEDVPSVDQISEEGIDISDAIPASGLL